MGGWVPCQAEWWATMVHVLESSGQRWQEDCARMDLRVYADSRDGIPSRRVLARRWRWTDGEVRGLLRRSEEWWDPAKGPTPRLAAARPADRPDPACTQPDPAGPSVHPSEMEQPGVVETPDPAGPTLHPAGPSVHHTRSDPPSPSPSQAAVEGARARAVPPRGDETEEEALARAVAAVQETHPERGLHPLDTEERRLVLRAWREGRATAEQLAAVWLWVQLSGEREPRNLREGDTYGWSTVLNGRLRERIAPATAWIERGRVDARAPPTGRGRKHIDHLKELQEQFGPFEEGR